MFSTFKLAMFALLAAQPASAGGYKKKKSPTNAPSDAPPDAPSESPIETTPAPSEAPSDAPTNSQCKVKVSIDCTDSDGVDCEDLKAPAPGVGCDATALFEYEVCNAGVADLIVESLEVSTEGFPSFGGDILGDLPVTSLEPGQCESVIKEVSLDLCEGVDVTVHLTTEGTPVDGPDCEGKANFELVIIKPTPEPSKYIGPL